MTNATTQKKLIVRGGDGGWPWLMLPADQLPQVLPLFEENGVKFIVSEWRVSLDQEPEYATVRFVRSGDAEAIQRLLDRAP